MRSHTERTIVQLCTGVRTCGLCTDLRPDMAQVEQLQQQRAAEQQRAREAAEALAVVRSESARRARALSEASS